MPQGATDLAAYLKEHAGESVHRILYYELEHYEVIYLREDVADRYPEAKLAEIAREARFEAIEAPMYEDMYTPDHGPLQSQIKWYTNVVELNFPLNEHTGYTIALETATLQNLPQLITNIQTILPQHH